MIRRWFVSAGAAAAAFSPAGVRAEAPSGHVAECAPAYEQSQIERKEGLLQSARQKLLICSGEACPNWMRKDCQSWFDEVEHAIPTVVLAVTLDGEDVTRVHADLDGHPWLDEISLRALPMEIGEHTIVFTVPGYSPLVKKVILSEGEKLKRVQANFAKPGPPTQLSEASLGPDAVRLAPQTAGTGSPSPAFEGPIPAGTWVLGGIALASLFAATGIALDANNEKGQLEGSCAPRCSSDEVDSLRTRYTLADVLFGASLAAGAGAAVWYLLRPVHSHTAPTVGLSTTLTGGGGVVRLTF